MFKKLLSNLPFNPSLIGQVSFYAKRMHSEASIRRIGLTFVLIAMCIQIFAVIAPPEPSLARSGNDIIPGGVTSKNELVSWCNDNLEIKTIFIHFGVTCANLGSGTEGTVNSRDHGSQLYSLGRLPYGKQGETPVVIGDQTFYLRYLWAWDTSASSTYKALKGTRADGSPFYVLFDCGNLVMVGLPAPKEKPSAGAFDIVDCDYISGWAFDESLPTASISVHIYIDGKLFTGAQANQSRPDVGAAFPGAGNNHGFRVATPASIKDKKPHKVEVYAIGIDASGKLDSVNPLIGTKPVTLDCSVKSTPPPPPTTKIPNIEPSKRAKNLTQGIEDANGTVAQPGDVIEYSLITKNTGNGTKEKHVVRENLTDVLEYASITNFHGGELGANNLMSWPAKNIKAGETVVNKVTVKVKSSLPLTPSPPSNPGSFDMLMTNVYGNVVNIKLPKPPIKTIETTTTLPNTGPGETVAVAFGLTTIVAYFFARSRLMAKELDVVRTDYANTGSI